MEARTEMGSSADLRGPVPRGPTAKNPNNLIELDPENRELVAVWEYFLSASVKNKGPKFQLNHFGKYDYIENIFLSLKKSGISNKGDLWAAILLLRELGALKVLKGNKDAEHLMIEIYPEKVAPVSPSDGNRGNGDERTKNQAGKTVTPLSDCLPTAFEVEQDTKASRALENAFAKPSGETKPVPDELDGHSQVVWEHLFSRNRTTVELDFEEVRLDYSDYDSRAAAFADLKEEGIGSSKDLEETISFLETIGAISTRPWGTRDKVLVIRLYPGRISQFRETRHKKINDERTRIKPKPSETAVDPGNCDDDLNLPVAAETDSAEEGENLQDSVGIIADPVDKPAKGVDEKNLAPTELDEKSAEITAENGKPPTSRKETRSKKMATDRWGKTTAIKNVIPRKLSPKKIARFKELVSAPGFLLPIEMPPYKITTQETMLELVIAATELPGFPKIDIEFLVSALGRERPGKRMLKRESILHNHMPFMCKAGVLKSQGTGNHRQLWVSDELVKTVLSAVAVKPTGKTKKTAKQTRERKEQPDDKPVAEKIESLSKQEIAQFRRLVNTPDFSLVIKNPYNYQTPKKGILAVLKAAVDLPDFPRVTKEFLVATLVGMGLSEKYAGYNHPNYLCKIGILLKSGWGKKASFQVSPVFVRKTLAGTALVIAPSGEEPGTETPAKVISVLNEALSVSIQLHQKMIEGYDEEIASIDHHREEVVAKKDEHATALALLILLKKYLP